MVKVTLGSTGITVNKNGFGAASNTKNKPREFGGYIKESV